MAYVKIKNLEGTAEKKCNCGSWLQHWDAQTSLKMPEYCVANNCTNKVEVGAHVKQIGGSDDKHYIVPFCQSCNKSDKEFMVSSAYLVSANKTLTCKL
ncbi:MAG: hypothetical protein IT215_09435 [Chitinophagaceae bacterium]|nr:hypothetical protein [Chitinophagaceae bacterium]